MGKRTGRPRGRPRGPWPLKDFRYAIRVALMRRLPDGRRHLDLVAERMVELALSGDLEAFNAIADHVYGRLPSPSKQSR